MPRTTISLQDYELAERELALRHAKRLWIRHTAVFGVAVAVLLLLELLAGGTVWWPYILLVGWAGALFVHYRWAVRYGEAHIREEQVRIEWRAGRSKEKLVPRFEPIRLPSEAERREELADAAGR
jgi:2TM domain-containing protein